MNGEMIKKIKTLVKSDIFAVTVAALLGFLGLNYYFEIVAGNVWGYSLFSVFVFIAIFIVFKFELGRIRSFDKNGLKRLIIISAIFSWFFSVMMIMGAQLSVYKVTDGGFVGKGLIVIRGLTLSLVIFPLFFEIIRFCASLTEKVKIAEIPDKAWKSSKLFFISWASIFLLWFPVFLAYYPAVMTYDFHRQSQEAAHGFIWFNSYQPIIHTLYIWLCFQIGNSLGSLQTGMAFYSIGQMLIMSVVLGYSVNLIYRLCRRKWLVIVSVLFLGLFPFISVMAVSATKDSIFGAMMLLFVCLFIERNYFSEGKKKWIIDILWVIQGIFMCLWRNNAIYVVIIFSIFYFLFLKGKERLRILLLCVVLCVCGKAAPGLLQDALGSEIHGSRIEAYSVILQSVARVGYYHGYLADELDDETFDMVHTLVDCSYWQYYAPNVSDPIKGRVAGDNYINFWQDNMGTVIKYWFKIGLKYPNEYIDAFLETVRGFWYSDDTSWADIWYAEGYHCGALSTNNTTTSDVIPDGIARSSKFPLLESFIDPLVSENKILDLPMFINLFKPAIYCWFLLFGTILLLFFKQKKNALVYAFPLLYIGTQFFGPIVQVRYMLPVMIIVPLLISLWLYKEEKE